MAQNSATSASKPTRGRPFPKGQSGNPGGRPKVLADLRDACRERSSEALDALMAAMKEGGAVSVSAARVILAYGYGQPLSAEESRAEAGNPARDPLEGLTKEEILTLARLPIDS